MGGGRIQTIPIVPLLWGSETEGSHLPLPVAPKLSARLSSPLFSLSGGMRGRLALLFELVSKLLSNTSLSHSRKVCLGYLLRKGKTD